MIDYHSTNYRKNIVTYWRQWYPDYTIPKGFHVHHIVSQSEASKLGWSDEQINHPRNLIVLHPDDHAVIHGDTYPFNTYVISASMKGKDNPRWTGVKVTPFGRFDTCEELKEQLRVSISSNYLNRLCGGDMDPITEMQYIKTDLLHLYGEECIGKTPYEIGFGLDATDVNVPRKRLGRAVEERHGGWKGYYHTPWGTFTTSKDAGGACPEKISASFIKTLCIYKNNEHITAKQRSQSSYLKSFDGCVGLTPYMIGFGHDDNDTSEYYNEPVSVKMYTHKEYGEFYTIKELNECIPLMSESYTVDVYEKGLDRIITKQSYSRSLYLKGLGEDVVGLTWRQIGFDVNYRQM